ncbi:MAG: hypothetical protein J6R32_05080 [Bacteroidales bacterium]|nr:hypothetical protein [Bacteroidales bacterium]
MENNIIDIAKLPVTDKSQIVNIIALNSSGDLIKTNSELDQYVKRNELSQTVGELENKIETKQDVLVSGENIKTINGKSILGNGDIEIKGGSGGGAAVTVYDMDAFNFGNLMEVFEKYPNGEPVVFKQGTITYNITNAEKVYFDENGWTSPFEIENYTQIMYTILVMGRTNQYNWQTQVVDEKMEYKWCTYTVYPEFTPPAEDMVMWNTGNLLTEQYNNASPRACVVRNDMLMVRTDDIAGYFNPNGMRPTTATWVEETENGQKETQYGMWIGNDVEWAKRELFPNFFIDIPIYTIKFLVTDKIYYFSAKSEDMISDGVNNQLPLIKVEDIGAGKYVTKEELGDINNILSGI